MKNRVIDFLPSVGSAVIFWQKVVRRDPDFPGDGSKVDRILMSCNATVIGESEPLCSYCRQSEDRHGENKPTRKHEYDPTYKGLTLDVWHVDHTDKADFLIDPFRQFNVQHGYNANMWTHENEVEK